MLRRLRAGASRSSPAARLALLRARPRSPAACDGSAVAPPPRRTGRAAAPTARKRARRIGVDAARACAAGVAPRGAGADAARAARSLLAPCILGRLGGELGAPLRRVLLAPRPRRARAGARAARRAVMRRSRLASSTHDVTTKRSRHSRSRAGIRASAAARSAAMRAARRPSAGAACAARGQRSATRRQRGERKAAPSRAFDDEIHVSEVSTCGAPRPGTRPIASRAGARPCAGTRAPAALRCTTPRARPPPT